MIIKKDTYIINTSELNLCKLSGSLRLSSQLAYNEPFTPIKYAIECATEKLTIDIKELEFLNSAGVIALAKLIILSRQLDKEIQLIINSHIPWQQLTLSPLTKLWEKLTISAEN